MEHQKTLHLGVLIFLFPRKAFNFLCSELECNQAQDCQDACYLLECGGQRALSRGQAVWGV